MAQEQGERFAGLSPRQEKPLPNRRVMSPKVRLPISVVDDGLVGKWRAGVQQGIPVRVLDHCVICDESMPAAYRPPTRPPMLVPPICRSECDVLRSSE